MKPPMVNDGASKKSIVAAQRAISDIVNLPGADKTIQIALGVFERVCAVSNVSIADCTFTSTFTVPAEDEE